MIYEPPKYDAQSSITCDSDTCQTQATIHAIEMKQGNKQRWSVRAPAVLAGIDPRVGGTIQQVVNAINHYGLIPYDLWPDLDDPWTNDQFFAPIPKNILAQANKAYSFSITNKLELPYLVEIKPSSALAHLTAQYTDFGYSAKSLVFDSYQPSVKPLTTWVQSAIVGKWSLIIKLKTMLPGYKVIDPIKSGDETVYVIVGNSLVPIADWQAFLNLGGSDATVVLVTQAWLNGMQVVYGDLFKTNS